METGRNFQASRKITGSQERPGSRHTWSNQPKTNIHEAERVASAIGGGALAILGITKRGIGGWTLALLGGGLAWRSLTGHCPVYEAMGINTASDKNQRAGVQEGQGIKVEKSITINKTPRELYQFWSNLENLPRFMDHLESVRVLDNKTSHWIAKGPLGTTVEWDAEIINQKENELLAWRSVAGATVSNAGSVRFEKHPDGKWYRG